MQVRISCRYDNRWSKHRLIIKENDKQVVVQFIEGAHLDRVRNNEMGEVKG